MPIAFITDLFLLTDNTNKNEINTPKNDINTNTTNKMNRYRYC